MRRDPPEDTFLGGTGPRSRPTHGASRVDGHWISGNRVRDGAHSPKEKAPGCDRRHPRHPDGQGGEEDRGSAPQSTGHM